MGVLSFRICSDFEVETLLSEYFEKNGQNGKSHLVRIFIRGELSTALRNLRFRQAHEAIS